MDPESNSKTRCDTCYHFMQFKFCTSCHIKKVTCAECHVPFVTLKKFRNHLQEHLTAAKITFACWAEVRRHKIPFRMFVCPHCENFLCEKLSDLVKHQRLIHKIRGNYICAHCGKRYLTKKTIRIHIRKHNTEPQFKCRRCGEKFHWLSKLKSHAMQHRTVARYSCEYCKKRFKSVFLLRRHVSQHTVEKPYACKLCDRTFRFHFSLKRHELTHVESRPNFECDHCDKVYNWKTDLIRHIRHNHLKANLHTCTVCKKKFSRKSYLVQHETSHGQAKAFLCFCGRTFRYQSNLTRHRRSKHEKLNNLTVKK